MQIYILPATYVDSEANRIYYVVCVQHTLPHLATVLEVLRADVDEVVDLGVVHAMPQPVHEHRGLRVPSLESIPDARCLHQLRALMPVLHLAVGPVVKALPQDASV